MASCEMCGREVPALRRATVEGTLMNVCGNCVKFGVEQAGIQAEVTGRSRVAASLEQRAQRAKPRDIYNSMQEELAADYSERIRDARTKRGMSVEQLAGKLMERQTVLAKVESGSYHPDDALVRKLERELGIKLMEKPEVPTNLGPAPKAQGAFTLGDIIKRELEKK